MIVAGSYTAPRIEVNSRGQLTAVQMTPQSNAKPLRYCFVLIREKRQKNSKLLTKVVRIYNKRSVAYEMKRAIHLYGSNSRLKLYMAPINHWGGWVSVRSWDRMVSEMAEIGGWEVGRLSWTKEHRTTMRTAYARFRTEIEELHPQLFRCSLPTLTVVCPEC